MSVAVLVVKNKKWKKWKANILYKWENKFLNDDYFHRHWIWTWYCSLIDIWN